jgi:hypothetical protein
MTDTVAGFPVVDVADQDEWIKGLIYGIPGSGKTRLLAALARSLPKPLLWIDTEKGTRSIRKEPDIKVLEVDTRTGKGGAIKTSGWEKLQKIYNELAEGNITYKTIIIDNLSESQELSMQHTMWRLGAVRPERVDPNNPNSGPDKREWGQSNEKVLKMVRAYRDIDAHVLFSAHTRNITNDAGQVLNVVPGLPGQLAFKVPGFLDLVIYLYVKDQGGETKRYLMTKPSEKYICNKDRSDNLDKVIEVPSDEGERNEMAKTFIQKYMEEI